jgi:hypothetical protein
MHRSGADDGQPAAGRATALPSQAQPQSRTHAVLVSKQRGSEWQTVRLDSAASSTPSWVCLERGADTTAMPRVAARVARQ